ncbi:hypothetical protein DUE52_05520 [Larkinella punicea]|uniref:Uncharacterized protein n=2 Tax=Larkinella punicea TaxID=2315727 RepID=A0A368JUR9_9BACT|nr:hypothetical protein DUE52_05520 [Larkinella punicea]
MFSLFVLGIMLLPRIIDLVWYSEELPTIEQEKEEIEKEPFNKEIISNTALYEKLMSFLAEKSDTIINSINGTNLQYRVLIENKSDTIYRTITHFEDCYSFPYNHLPSDSIPKIPTFLLQENDNIWSELAVKRISFKVCKENKVTFMLGRRTNHEKYIYIQHSLYWKDKSFNREEHSVYKDTLLNKKIIYVIEATSAYNNIVLN